MAASRAVVISARLAIVSRFAIGLSRTIQRFNDPVNTSQISLVICVALITTLAVAVAVILVSASAYVVFRHDMLDTVDGTLTSQAETLNNARTQGGLRAALDLLFSPPSLLANQPAEQ